MSGRGGGGFLAGAVVGGLVGAGLGVLLAPRSGRQTRAEFAEWRAATRPADEPASPTDDLLELGQAVIRSVLERFEAARDAASRASEETERALLGEWERRKRGDSDLAT